MLRDWFTGVRKYSALGACVVLAAAATTSRADDAAELRMLIEQQSRQIQELKTRLDQHPVAAEAADAPAGGDAAVKKIVADYLKEEDAKKKAATAAAKTKEEEEGYKMGTDRSGGVRWDGFGWLYESGHKDFIYHVGARFQDDWVWWGQDNVSQAQIGNFQDGTFFRRIRINFDGTAWEVCEFNLEFLFDQIRQGIVGLDEFYVGLKELPIIGTARVGNFHVPQGLEGDMYSSSKSMTFMERSSMTDAIFEGENLMPGILLSNNCFCQHMSWQAWAGRQSTLFHDTTGADFGDGQYACIGRITALPVYEDHGRLLLHLGASVKWAKASKEDPVGQNVYPNSTQTMNGVTTAVGNVPSVRLRARPELRDLIGDYGRATYATGTTNVFLPGDDARLVDTGAIAADSMTVFGSEFLAIAGPFSLQAEYALMNVNGARGALAAANPTQNAGTVGGVGNTIHNVPTRGTLSPFVGGDQSLYFYGGYVQASYVLTGESRGYDRRFGKLATNIFNVNTPFWATRRDGCGCIFGRGAWEAAVRYSYLDLNDGPVRGGIMEGWTLGLNWYLNNNFKFQFDYIHDIRYDRGPVAGTPANPAGFAPPGLNGNGPPLGGTIPTFINGFGIRTQIYF